MPRYWLMKSEPNECSIDDLVAATGQTLPWTGVRNYQARNFMRDHVSRQSDGGEFDRIHRQRGIYFYSVVPRSVGHGGLRRGSPQYF